LIFRTERQCRLPWIPATSEVLFAASKDQPDYATTRASLWAVTINPDRAEIVGDVRAVTTSTGLHDSPSVARTGRIVFSEPRTESRHLGGPD
jgi:hypothetical protein